MIIGIDGTDGSGKTYTANFLNAELRNRGYKTKLVIGRQLVIGTSDDITNLIQNKLLRLDVLDVKELIYLAIAISTWKDMLEWEKENPKGIIIKDRTWLTVLTYTGLKPYNHFKRHNMLGIIKPLITQLKHPDITYLFLSKFDKEKVKHRDSLKDYYKDFPAEEVEKRYLGFMNWMKTSIPDIHFKIFEQDTIEEFKERNTEVLEDILERLR